MTKKPERTLTATDVALVACGYDSTDLYAIQAHLAAIEATLKEILGVLKRPTG